MEMIPVPVAPLDQQLGTYLTQRRFQTSLLTGFSVVALLMAAVGIYGLIHYSVATRTESLPRPRPASSARRS